MGKITALALKSLTKKDAGTSFGSAKWPVDTPRPAPYRSHHCRDTGRTQPHIVDKMLNHAEQNKLVRIYQRANFEAEQAEGWRLLGERLQLLTQRESSNVIVAKFS